MVNLHFTHMSPYNWNGPNSWANVFYVASNGYLNTNIVNGTYGVRPIPFLNSHTKLWQSIAALRYKINL